MSTKLIPAGREEHGTPSLSSAFEEAGSAGLTPEERQQVAKLIQVGEGLDVQDLAYVISHRGGYLKDLIGSLIEHPGETVEDCWEAIEALGRATEALDPIV